MTERSLKIKGRAGFANRRSLALPRLPTARISAKHQPMQAPIALTILRRAPAVLTLAPLLLLVACDRIAPAASPAAPGAASTGSGHTAQYTYEIVHTYPHDRGAFTEGLLYLNGFLYESTGLNGQSSVRKVELTTGKVLQQADVPAQYFGEGLAALHGKLYQLTWRQNTGFVYDLETFSRDLLFSYQGEGWGLTSDGQSLIQSDGSDQIRFVDPATFQVKRAINVRENGRAVPELNELEYVKGEIYANVWQTEHILRINPTNGEVLGDINLAGILPAADRDATTDVMNGIAYDAASDRLFITGKNWPKLFEIKLKPE